MCHEENKFYKIGVPNHWAMNQHWVAVCLSGTGRQSPQSSKKTHTRVGACTFPLLCAGLFLPQGGQGVCACVCVCALACVCVHMCTGMHWKKAPPGAFPLHLFMEGERMGATAIKYSSLCASFYVHWPESSC